MTTLTTYRLWTAARALSLGTALLCAGTSSWANGPAWYATGAAGTVLGHPSVATHVDEGQSRLPIRLAGQTRMGGGETLAVAVGREFELQQHDWPQRMRVEAELWHGSVRRERFAVAALDAQLSDRVNASAGFINGLVPLVRNDKMALWAGIGLGHARVRTPDATAAAPGCGCLSATEGRGTALRLKLQAERYFSPTAAVFLELGHTRLPGGQTSGALATRTQYGQWSVTHLSVGVRSYF